MCCFLHLIPLSRLLPMPQPPPLSICCLAYALASGGTSLRMLHTVSQGTACGTEPQQLPEVSNNQATLGQFPSFPVSLPHHLHTASWEHLPKQQFAFNGLPCGLLLKEHNLRHSHIKHLLEEEGKRKDNITGKSQYKTKHTACWVFRYNLGIMESWIRKYKPVTGSYTAREP